MKMIAVLLLAGVVSGGSVVYDIQCSDGDKIAHDSDDTKVLECFQGLYVLKNCPPGFKYRAEYKKCFSSYITEDDKISVSLADPVCLEGHRIPYFGPDTLPQTRYYECLGGFYTQMICPGQKPRGQNSNFQKCIPFSVYSSQGSVPPTRECHEGDMKAHESDATKVYQCFKGFTYVVLECPTGFTYRVDARQCYSTHVDTENKPGFSFAHPVCREGHRIPDVLPPRSPPPTHYQCLGGSYILMVCPLKPHQRGLIPHICHPKAKNGNKAVTEELRI
ncbi:uncharacterized protein LOC124356252 [Homalodisca vitripennis]|uniref:uncharacterized protein LOC124356252 n=1 Tax=Homalodisca vitripennis TaxID=197043 RepID=UPI001EE9D4F8|nr:uncharacterized protein LOC124356252 [Homalodisca vitripennis]XP_046663393.1 uncharacterized protein LOC124356252 [Homalodisca vitripennis]XP_046663394.1 uncharacterized protein LOC124356252 [Homalodisca vitripennis]XP_046663395.1 uncharacterized protein LOC124356252 [Homalodisca vitripennis]